ncbi:MAG TPA: hypothetical protein DIT32_00180 [Peptococcaceae bacterium]|nr:hypothetical protein [Peptococcaceae bacterium]
MTERKKELREQYKAMQLPMGLFAVRTADKKKYYLVTTVNLKGKMNSVAFQLKNGGLPNKALQKEYIERGADGFVIEILQELEYDKDESKTDYKEELDILKLIWEEKLQKDGIELY